MKRKKLTQTIALALLLVIGGSIAPSLSASAAEVTIASDQKATEKGTSITFSEFKNASTVEILDENTILIDGKSYDFNNVANVLCKEIDSQKATTRNPATAGIKKGAKWIVKNWQKIEKKLPDNVKKYFKLDAFMKVMDQYIGISDSIEEFLNSCFREMGMPEWANWAITNAIMVIIPI
ncbi:hypothetical protein [Clostridium sp. C2-6-12]|uniref:hypothetical protein n=1 Tax=Clostridium sp. C2-6-12 TaxID=2698832 RepID=UPI001367D58A|nr:hypothetical protein [Clostridium sp. C2-6-12]